MTVVFQPGKYNRQRLIDAGFASVVYVPVLFGNKDNRSGYYLPEMNRYLRERALLEWTPFGDTAEQAARRGRKLTYPTVISMKNFAYWGANFLDWCDWSGKDWRKVRYTEEIVQGYQADMEAGRWSDRGAPLKPGTVGPRVNEACNFLTWAAERGYREPFKVIKSPVSVKADTGNYSYGHKAKVVQARAGGVRLNPKNLHLPKDAEITKWSLQVLKRKGPVKLLMCDLILGVGCRLEEAAQWRVDTLPLDPNEWYIIGDNVRVTLKFGTKGAKIPDPRGRELIGPSRTINIPLKLALRLHEYRKTLRLKALNVWRKTHRGEPVPVHLFLSETTGGPITSGRLYDAWHTPPLPFVGWSPQLGRHWWACTTLIRHLRRHAEQVRLVLEQMPHGWVDDSARSIIDTVIRPQLGHIDLKTTEIYLQWIQQILTLTDLYIDYHRSFEEDDDNG